MVQDFGTKPDTVKSASRTFRVLEYFDEIRRPARAKEIADSLDFPQSSTSVLLNSLVKLGYLDFDISNRTYLPSLRTAVLATWRDTGYFRNGAILNMLEKLATESQLAACLTSRSGIFVRYLNIVQFPKPGDFHVTLTARRYAVHSAAGIVLVSPMSENDIRTLVYRTKAENDPSVDAIKLDAVLDRINKARRTGYFVSQGLVDPRTAAIAVALPDEVTGGWEQMALSLAGLRDDVEDRADTLLANMRNALAELTRTSPSAAIPPQKSHA